MPGTGQTVSECADSFRLCPRRCNDGVTCALNTRPGVLKILERMHSFHHECRKIGYHETSSIVPSPARSVAFEVLRQVERGGYAADLLFALSAPLDSRDAGLASEIALGVLGYQ